MSESAPIVLPWKPPQKLTNSCLPVWLLASRSALSTASAPLRVELDPVHAGAAAAVRDQALDQLDPRRAR